MKIYAQPNNDERADRGPRQLGDLRADRLRDEHRLIDNTRGVFDQENPGGRPCSARLKADPYEAIEHRIEERRPIEHKESKQTDQQRLLQETDQNILAFERAPDTCERQFDRRDQKQNPRRRRREQSGTRRKHSDEGVEQ